MAPAARLLALSAVALLGSCGTSDGGLPDASTKPPADASRAGDAASSADLAAASDAAQPPPDTLDGNRDRLIATYLAYLQKNPTVTQSNGLSGGNLTSVCDLWSKLDPSGQAVFLTLTARMQGSLLGDDGSSMLSHIQKVYRISGGQGATATDPGSCGGGEYNRMIMSMDAHLHEEQLSANANQGARQGNGKYNISDIPPASFWRDSHDLGGAHSPFDLSDETDQGAPRGQTQYFKDPASQLAMSPLGRLDLTTLVDPLAIEMDQDYDCPHNSNPSCSYTTYGPLCFPETSTLGTDLYTQSYGSFEPGWKPSGC